MAHEPLLGASALRLGSNDADAGNSQVAQLQAALRRLQVLQPNEPVTAGVFDANTEISVRRLQWFAGRVPGALSTAGAFVARPLTRLAVDGIAGDRTKLLIRTFMDNGWAATGLLVKLRFALLSHTHPNAGFAALIDGDAGIGVCESEFADVMTAMDAAARRFGVSVFVNQLFRAEGSALSDAIVPPASFSAHKIGRAVDLQLGSSATPQTGTHPQASIHIMNATAGTPFANFRQHATSTLKCRYGGDFDPADPPHFDRQILKAGSQRWRMHYFFNQLQYRQAMVNASAIADASRSVGAAAEDTQ